MDEELKTCFSRLERLITNDTQKTQSIETRIRNIEENVNFIRKEQSDMRDSFEFLNAGLFELSNRVTEVEKNIAFYKKIEKIAGAAIATLGGVIWKTLKSLQIQ